MNLLKQKISNPCGSTLIIVVLVLLAVSMMGLAAINISTIDINLASNEKWQKQGFYNADSGFHGTPNIIGQPFQPNRGAPAPANPGDGQCLNYLNTLDQASFETFLITQVGEDGCDPNTPPFKDISFRNCGVLADIDICPTRSKSLSGGGVEFAAKAEGLGLSGTQYAYFRITSTGDGTGTSTYDVRGHYRWTDVPGGIN